MQRTRLKYQKNHNCKNHYKDEETDFIQLNFLQSNSFLMKNGIWYLQDGFSFIILILFFFFLLV